MPNPTGLTTTALNLRAGPDTTFDVLALLPPRTSLEVLARQGDWLQVLAAGQPGYVHHAYVELPGQGVPDGFLGQRPSPPAAADPLAAVPLTPAEADRIRLPAGAGGTEKLVANTWNKYGGLLCALAGELRLDPGVAVAVLAVEAGGRCFGPDGRLIIRFENHLFYDHWGRHHPERFRDCFAYAAEKRWQGHRWRPAADQPWREFHGSQAGEWEAFSFARSLDDTAAKLSISMGGPQIVGFNYAALGYESVHQMFDAFSSSERSQIVGFFDFIQGPGTNSRRVLALQALDFTTFAAFYNGPGQAARYGSLIQGVYETYQRLRPN